MKTFLIGNSIVRELQDSSFTTISVPGLTWTKALRLIRSDVERFSDSIIYIHIGPVRFSHLEQSGSHRRCSLNRFNNSNPGEIVRPFVRLLRDNNINIVICTIYPMDFTIYNRHLSSGARVNEGDNDTDTRQMRSMVVIENRLIVNFNMQNNMATPYMHRRIFTRRNHTYRFRARLLRDGLHPNRDIVRDWSREIRRVNVLNLGRLRRRFVQ